MKKTLVLGASENPSRFSNMAIKSLLRHHHEVIAVGNREGVVEGVKIVVAPPQEKDIHTVTLYLNPTNQERYYDYILNLKPKRIVFNPGTENPELKTKARQQGIETTEACTLVMLDSSEY